MDAGGDLRDRMISPGAEGDTMAGALWRQVVTAWHTVMGMCLNRTVRVHLHTVRIVRQVAEGGYSFVYLAEDTTTGERYALKEMLCQSSEQRAAARREVEVHLSCASHPNLAPLVDYAFEPQGDGTERAYLLLPYYHRGSVQDFLLSRMPSGPYFDEATCLRVMQGVAKAVVALHSRSPPLAHRDICPRNVMLDEGGRVVVIDLGSVAPARVPIRSRADGARLKEDAMLTSSMPYRAVELWEPPPPGPDVMVDERTDVWSMGATLFAMAFGYSPFESQRSDDGTTLRLAECTHLRTLGDLPFPARHAFSSEFVDLIRWMLQKEGAARPSARDVLSRIEALMTGASGGVGRDASGFVTVDIGRGSSAEFNPFAEIAKAAGTTPVPAAGAGGGGGGGGGPANR